MKPDEAPADPTQVVGTYELKDGVTVRLDAPTIHADVAEGREATMDLSAAQALAATNERLGFPVPPVAQAAIERAEKAAAAAAEKAEQKAARSQARKPSETSPADTNPNPAGQAEADKA